MSNRIDKYKAKMDSDVLKRRYNDTKKLSVDKKAATIGREVELEEKVKVIIDGEPSFLQHYYMVFAKEYDKALRKHSDSPLSRETVIVEGKWTTRGLNINYLNGIILMLTGRSIIGEVCLFDVGRFDVNVFG